MNDLREGAEWALAGRVFHSQEPLKLKAFLAKLVLGREPEVPGSGMSGAVVVNDVGPGEELLEVRGMDAMDSFVDMLGQVQLTPHGKSCQTEFFPGLGSRVTLLFAQNDSGSIVLQSFQGVRFRLGAVLPDDVTIVKGRDYVGVIEQEKT